MQRPRSGAPGSGQTSGLAPMGVFELQTAIVRYAIQDNWWNSLLEIRPRRIVDPRFAAKRPPENKELVDEIVNSWTRTRTKHEVEQELNKHGVPAGAVLIWKTS